MRIVFVNLHGNEFLVKPLNKFIFKKSVAIKHKYFLEYLLSRNDVEVCSYINKRGLSLSYTTRNKFLQSFRFMEHRITMKKNEIPLDKITVLKSEDEIRHDDIVVLYQISEPQFEFDRRPDAFVAVSQLHFTLGTSSKVEKLDPDLMFNESNMQKRFVGFDEHFGWFHNEYLVNPFVFADRFKVVKPFAERQNKAVSVGTITYPGFVGKYYGNNCLQPARKQVYDHAKELTPWVDCFNSDYLEEVKARASASDRGLMGVLNRLNDKFFLGHQKKYFSFDMVEKFNDYKMCVVGEEIVGLPGIGFVEGMACGCAYLGQTVGYYEDYGMKAGVHYIGYDGTLDDLKAKISFYQQPEHQEELETIAKTGCEFVRSHFNGPVAAASLLNNLLNAQRRWLEEHPKH
jgi:hypothetical protein